MKSYRGLIATEVIALAFLAALADGRAKVIWYTLLGQTTAVKGTRPANGSPLSGSVFTPIGIIAGGVIAIRYGKGAFGAGIAGFLAIVLIAATLLNYQNLLPLFIRQVQPVGGSSST